MQQPHCYRLGPQGLSLFVRVTPNAGRDAIEGVESRDDGTAVLRIRVKAAPDKGKANAAAAVLLASALATPRTSITVTQGQTSRFKTMLVAGDAETLALAVEGLTRR